MGPPPKQGRPWTIGAPMGTLKVRGDGRPRPNLVKGSGLVILSKGQSVYQRDAVECRCRLSPTADVPSHTSGAAMGSAEAPELRVTRLKYSGVGTIWLPDRFLASMQF